MNTFVSNRTDGFGERLKALLNAVVMAKNTHGKFSFGWPIMSQEFAPDHCILSAARTFSPAFVEKYFLDQEVLKGLQLVPLSEVTPDQLSTDDESLAILVNQGNLKKQVEKFASKFDFHFDHGRAFKEIEFSEELEIAREAAYSATLPAGATALHLRAGDVVYGRFRFTDRYHKKVLPLPLAVRLVSDLIDQGKTPIIFGQDAAVLQFLKGRFDVKLASEVSATEDFCDLQQALFEICLMARCPEIYAGMSGFALVAAWIGGGKRIDPRTVYDSKMAVDIIHNMIIGGNSPAEVPALQLSFACRSACLFAGQAVPHDRCTTDLLEKARALDPKNDFYHLVHACRLYNTGECERAETVIFDLLNRSELRNRAIYRVLSPIAKGADVYAGEMHDHLIEMAQKGWPMAALCTAILQYTMGKKTSARKFYGIFETNCPVEWNEVGNRVMDSFGIEI